MTRVSIGENLGLQGTRLKIEDEQVPGMYKNPVSSVFFVDQPSFV